MSYNINSGYGAATAGAIPIGAGKVFYVAQTGTDALAYLEKIFPVDSDGVQRVYGATAATSHTAIQAALDACVTNRNDYVIIMPAEADYDLTATLTMSKKAVHLICPAGMGNEVGSTNAARFHQNTTATPCITVSNSAVEIAGIYFKNYAQYSAIYAATSSAGVGVYGCNIHHNTFTMRSTTTAAQPMIYFNGDAGAWGSIEKNWFITAVSGATYTSIIQIEASATSARVKYNEISIGDGCTATLGISNAAIKGVTAFNIFSECGGSAVTPSGGAFGAAVSISTNGSAIRNMGAVAAGTLLAGGTAAHSFCHNIDGAQAGNAGHVTQLET